VGKIIDFLETEGNVFKSSKKKFGLNDFDSIKHCEPIFIHETWKYIKDNIEFDIYCLQYNYKEKEKIGDGLVGNPSRIMNFSFTSFWFISQKSINISSLTVEPITLENRLLKLIELKPLFGNMKFNLKYNLRMNKSQYNKTNLTNYIQELFVTYYKIWFESTGNAVLIRDDKSMDSISFKIFFSQKK